MSKRKEFFYHEKLISTKVLQNSNFFKVAFWQPEAIVIDIELVAQL